MPPAFILSQDQTLHDKILVVQTFAGPDSSRLELNEPDHGASRLRKTVPFAGTLHCSILKEPYFVYCSKYYTSEPATMQQRKPIFVAEMTEANNRTLDSYFQDLPVTSFMKLGKIPLLL